MSEINNKMEETEDVEKGDVWVLPSKNENQASEEPERARLIEKADAPAEQINRSAFISPHVNETSNMDQDETASHNFTGFNGVSVLHGHTEAPREKRSRYRGSSRSRKKRVIFKNGDFNVHHCNVSKKRRKYMADIFVTLVDLQWRYTLLIFGAGFVCSWTLFAMIFWLIAFTHGDFATDHLPDNQEKSGWTPCVSNFHGFTSALLFSVESQTTIGYGFRYPNEECPETTFFVLFQNIVGVMLQSFLAGVVFTKITRPKKRSQTLLFSKNAVICQRDGTFCLMFRLGDMRKESNIIGANIRAQMIRKKTTKEGENLLYYQEELKVGVDCDQQNVFLIWPMLVIHKIDRDSPLYGISAAELLRETFEIVVILEGVIETTGSTTQARTSYLPSEILWGHRFQNLVTFDKELKEYRVDYSHFHAIYQVDTPLCSAKDLDGVKILKNEIKRQGGRMIPYRVPPVALSAGFNFPSRFEEASGTISR